MYIFAVHAHLRAALSDAPGQPTESSLCIGHAQLLSLGRRNLTGRQESTASFRFVTRNLSCAVV